jgi:hypothetical protein
MHGHIGKALKRLSFSSSLERPIGIDLSSPAVQFSLSGSKRPAPSISVIGTDQRASLTLLTSQDGN